LHSPVVVAGMHRSGTSLAASIIAAGAVRMGDRLLEADRNNRHGYTEDLDFLELNRAVLAATTPTDDGGHPDWGWTEHDRRRPAGSDAFATRASELIAARTRTGERWGWKDPRTTLLLDFWHPLLDDPVYLAVYRSPWDVADSMQRMGAEVFLRNPGYGLAIWSYYNRHLLDFHLRHRDRSLLVSADALVGEPARFGELLEERLGVHVPEDRLASLVDPAALACTPPGDPLAALIDAVHPGASDLLRRLDTAADLAAERVWPATGPRFDASPTSPAARLAVVIPCFNQGETLIEAIASVERSPEELELVVVNDGSDEPATLDVLDALRARGYAIHDQANTGVAAARNAGVAHTRAAAVLPLDADNRLCPDFIAGALAVLEASPAVGVVYGNRREFGLRDGVVDVPPFDLPTLLTYNFIDACAVVRRTAWEAARGHDATAPISGWEDWEFWIAVAERGWAFHHLPATAFEYRVRPDSMVAGTTSPDARRRLYDHVIARHDALYREHLAEILMRGQSAAGDLVSIARDRDRLHGEIALRDEEIRQLHEDVAIRDEEIEPAGGGARAMNICTIVAKNYLAQARVLTESFRRHHPDGGCYVLVIDEIDGFVDLSEDDFVLVRPSDIGVEALERMRTAYSVTELSTALKPWLLRFMLDNHDDGGGVVYLDPDIQVHSRMVELEAELREHAVVLTPHVLRGMPRDGKRPSETDILQAGVYNLGFIGMSNRPDAHTVIDWWAERLVTDCLVAPGRGYFVDQRWVDFVPGLIDDLKILRDPGYNAAYWNVPERDLELRADQYWVGGRPLRFFHFSGYDPARRDVLSLHQTRVELSEIGLLHELCNGYADALDARGHQHLSTLPYEHDTLPSGLKLTRVMRSLYRRAVELEVGLGSPFTPDGETDFLAWLAGPADGAPGLNRFLHEVWKERADLRSAFPGVPAGDVNGYLGWLAAGGSAQIEGPASLIVRAEEAPSQTVPADEPAAPSPTEEAGVPEATLPTAPARRRPSGVNVVGYLRSEVGVGEVARQLIGALDAVGVTATATNIPAPNGRERHSYSAPSRPRNPFPINLLCMNADMLPAFAADVGGSFFADRYSIGVWWWETDHFPEVYHSSFELLDEVWVGSRFIAEALRPVSPIPVIHMPMPIVFPPPARLRAGEQEWWPDAFTFLFSWDYDSVFERKNPLAVAEAYTAAFAPHDGAALVLKSMNHERDPENHARLTEAVAGRPDIVLIDEYLDPRDKSRLMCSCDCYVSLHRSEGLGLTIAEALFYARPVIATGYSGNLELMDGANSYPVGYRVVPIGDRAAPYPADGTWAEPDVAEASRLMRQVFESPEAAAPRAAKAAQDMRQRHSAHAVGMAMRQRLVEIDPRVPDRALSPLAAVLGSSDVRTLRQLLDLRGRADVASRFGRLGTVARRLVLRMIRPHTAYQLEVNEALGQAVASLTEHAEALAEHVEGAAVRMELDLAESQAVLAAQIRQQQRELVNLSERQLTSDGSRPQPTVGVRNGDRST
jgi:glycosyltransferase involved in cell wall biosynthesis